MEDSLPNQSTTFHSACLNNDLSKVRETIKPSTINEIDPNGDTALHIATSKGYIDLVKLLLRYHACRTIQNKEGLIAEQVAANEEIGNLFKLQVRPKSDSQHFVGSTTTDVEWLDSYKNAYRISYENLEHMKRWLLKVPLVKLLEEIVTGYIDKMKFSNEKIKDEIKDYIQQVIEWERPVQLICVYTNGGNGFCTRLNYHLAEIGSDFRFLSTQNLFNSGYVDNEAPKDLGQHIYAAILINHPCFQRFYHKGESYRGMGITRDELKEYKTGAIVMTRSFLSTSKDVEIAHGFIQTGDNEKQPVMCIYKVTNPRSSLYIAEMSEFPVEKEVLIVPFAVFQIMNQEDVDMNINGKSYRVTVINLEECNANVQ